WLVSCGRARTARPPCGPFLLLAGACRLGLLHPLRHFRLHGVEIEARAPLHRRIVEEGLKLLRHDLLHEDKAPELELEPVEVLLSSVFRAAAGPTLTLERIEPQVRDVGDVRMGLLAEPPVGLINKAERVIVDPDRADRAFAQVEDLVALRR